MRSYLVTLLVAAAMTYLTTPIVRRIAVVGGVFSGVRDRDVHVLPTPRLGGVAMFIGFVSALMVASEITLVREVFQVLDDWRALLSGAVVILILGIIDDKWELDALTKLAGQVLAAGVMVLQGIQVLWIPVGGDIGIYVPPQELGIIATVLVVVVTINAVNFIDGLDGLAAGIVGIAASGFFVFSYLLSYEQGLSRATTPTLLSAIVAGMCLGFLPHNRWPARIFMGDSGSMLLGLLLAASMISLTGRVQPGEVSDARLTPALLLLLLPLLILIVPMMDLVLAIVRRTAAGRSPFSPDKQHLHHRLLEIGHSHRRAVWIMYIWSALIAFGALVMSFLGGPWPGVVIGVVVAAALVATLYPRARKSALPQAAAPAASSMKDSSSVTGSVRDQVSS